MILRKQNPIYTLDITPQYFQFKTGILTKNQIFAKQNKAMVHYVPNIIS